jgi:uncharacterized protein
MSEPREAPVPGEPSPEVDDEVVAFAHRMFDLVRVGDPTLADFVDAGLPVDLTNAQGNTLLLLAAYHGHTELVRALVSRGADVERINDRGQTPLAAAVFKGAADVVELLLGAGADPGAGTPSALETARFFERHELLARLELGG